MLYIKRFIDVTIAFIAILVVSPILLVIYFFILLSMGSPVFYKHDRAGMYGHPFSMIKFRTMTDDTDNDGAFLPDDERLTILGIFLRRTSLDELPQLFNVLFGSMSLVGPRPLPIEYNRRYSARHARRLSVKPGMTGWCQVKFTSNNRTWEQKLSQDCWYVNNWCIMLDIKIIIITFPVLLRRYIMNKKGVTTSDQFYGETSGDKV